MATSSASFFGILRTQIGASVQFSRMVRCGNRLKCWNTMPTSRRISSMRLMSLVSSIPSTTILPFWCSSSRLTQRIMVDLPEPDGPHTTMRSPRMTLRLMFLQNVEVAEPLVHVDDLDGDIGIRHLHVRMLGRGGGSGCFTHRGFPRSTPVAGVEPAFRVDGISRHAEAEEPEDEGGEDVAGRRRLVGGPVRSR